jgi:nitrite reductase (NADH) large subunit
MRYLIVGNGAAGIEAALNIRKLDSDGEIKIIAQSKNHFYYRPRLIEYLAGDIDFNSLLKYDEKFYQEKNIDIELGLKIVNIDKENKVVECEYGEKFSYDKLLIATGARSFIPTIKGILKVGIFKFRGVSDCDEILSYSETHKDVIIIGAGLLGIEAANSLKKRGKNVTIVEYCDRLLPNQLDKEGSDILRDKLEEKGINFILGDCVEEVHGRAFVDGLTLRSGKTMPCKVIILSTGIRPRLELAENLGLNTQRGIIVNNKMETNIKDIYAAGDVAEHNGLCYGLWIPSMEQGKIAGINMAGEASEYEGSTIETRLKVTGISVFSAGIIGTDEADVYAYKDDIVYRKFFVKDGKIIGAFIIGDPRSSLKVSKAINNGDGIETLKELL